jgi:UDP-N-acetylglucosamine/UDP-N-acetylgalactosamine diphosphorylase
MLESIEKVESFYKVAGQAQVFRFLDGLDGDSREKLLKDASGIDLPELEKLVKTLLNEEITGFDQFEDLQPAPYVSHPENGGDAALWKEATALGEDALRSGRVAAFTVAGGQGTRLGYDGPKGTFPVAPVSGNTLFQIFAEKLRASEIRYRTSIPWYIMTSAVNHDATVAAFEDADYFGLKEEQLMFFAQGRMPAVDFSGKILLENRDTIAMSPDGHGGSLRALVRSGAIADMRRRGVDTISYFQVDNPLVQVIDPAFIGFHLKSQSEMSSKMIPKAYPGEKVGHFCIQNDRMCVVEYSDMPMAMQEEQDEQGNLRFIAGSIAIHILDVGFVDRLGSGSTDAGLPFHKAVKKIRTVDNSGNEISPTEPNGVKFEMFVFDALPFAANPVVIETLREDDFSPVKNASGVDSADSSRADQIRQWTRWLKAAGVEIETDETGLPEFQFEISPLFADSESAFLERWLAMPEKPVIKNGLRLS